MAKGIAHNLLRGLGRCWPVSFLVRHVMTCCSGYDDAVLALNQTDLMAPTYIVVAGTQKGQGVVITRAKKSEQRLRTLDKDGPIVQSA